MKKRIISLCVTMSLLLSGLLGRVGYIIFSNNYAVSKTYNSCSVSLETLYPTLHYSNGDAINNNKTAYVAVLKPNERTVSDLHNLFPSSQINEISNELKKGKPLAYKVSADKKEEAKYIKVYEARESEFAAPQLFSAASSGLMKYIEPCSEKKISFHVDALGRMLRGDEGKVYEENINNQKDISLSINKEVEQIAINAAKSLESGCIVVMNTGDASILSCVTKPDTSYVNKALSQYSVGSVFKLAVAACALENNVDFYYNCTGSTRVGDTTFSCHNGARHGFENLKTALADSCNCYFINLAQKLGSEKLLQSAKKLGFGENIELFSSWSVKGSSLPKKSELASQGELALFGFGQGKLTSTPLQICSMLCTIAGKGKRNQPHLLASQKNTGAKEAVSTGESRALSENTCDLLLEYMRYVVSNGTGANAEDSKHKAAGKTATAQTGQFVFNREKLNTWFAGVYPCDNPEYAVVVMAENGSSGSKDCAPIYREIVEKLNNL